MQMSIRCIQLAIVGAALIAGALSQPQQDGVVIAPVQEAPQTIAPFLQHSHLYQTTTKIPEPTHLGTAPGESDANTVAIATAISVGLFVGILAVTLLVFTAVLVWRRNTTMEWNKIENAESTREFNKNEGKLPLSQISGSHGFEEHPKNTTM